MVRAVAPLVLVLACACGSGKPPQTPNVEPSAAASAPASAPAPEPAAPPTDVPAATAEVAPPGSEVHGPRALRAAPKQGVRALESDLGGPAALLELFETAGDTKVRSTLLRYDVGFSVDGEASDQCPRTFDAALRNAWHRIGSEFYFVDRSGRPARAYASLPRSEDEARNQACQAKVGRFGGAEDPGTRYDGGHLIGNQLGGYGERANLVPQELNFNRGNWKALEDRVARCASLPKGSILYLITVSYESSSTVVPDEFRMRIVNTEADQTIDVEFENAANGGATGTEEKNAAVDTLKSWGCT